MPGHASLSRLVRLTICEERSNAGATVTKRFFDEGFVDVASNTSYTYTRDHLGSVRELVDATGAVVSRFTYDPWGRRTQVSGTVDSPVGYAGYFRHAASGLDLTLFRAYDPEQGRWLSRDPLFEEGEMDKYPRNFESDHRCKMTCMAEALSPHPVTKKQWSFVFVENEGAQQIAERIVGTKPKVTVNRRMFPGRGQ